MSKEKYLTGRKKDYVLVLAPEQQWPTPLGKTLNERSLKE